MLKPRDGNPPPFAVLTCPVVVPFGGVQVRLARRFNVRAVGLEDERRCCRWPLIGAM